MKSDESDEIEETLDSSTINDPVLADPITPQKGTTRSPKSSFEWSMAKEMAAMEVARKELSLPEIAKKAGTSVATLGRWRTHPEFAARVAENWELMRQEFLSFGIADPAERTKAKHERWLALRGLVTGRGKAAAKDEKMKNVPGATSGLVVAHQKMIGKGDSSKEVTEYRFDASVYRELRELEMDAAKELGQLTDKVEHSGVIGLVALDPNVAYGYPLGSALDIALEFKALRDAGVDPLQHFGEMSRLRIEQEAAKKSADATATGRPE